MITTNTDLRLTYALDILKGNYALPVSDFYLTTWGEFGGCKLREYELPNEYRATVVTDDETNEIVEVVVDCSKTCFDFHMHVSILVDNCALEDGSEGLAYFATFDEEGHGGFKIAEDYSPTYITGGILKGSLDTVDGDWDE